MEETNNRFKKAANKPRVTPGGEHEPPNKVEPDPVVVEPAPEPTVTEKPVVENPLAGMIEVKSRNGKACGFYLSDEANDSLERLAKQNKCSKSKALDALLRSLF